MKTRKEYIEALVVVIDEVKKAGAGAFSPVLVGPNQYAVSTLLIRARVAMCGAPEAVATKARAALKVVVDGAVVRLEMTDDTLRGEAEDMSREARRANRRAA